MKGLARKEKSTFPALKLRAREPTLKPMASDGRVLWVKPFDPGHHQADTAGRRGECGWHGQTQQRGTCPNPPFASVKLQYADYAPVQSACERALVEISERYGFPIPRSAIPPRG
ncbi:hypothetical protein GCM10022214_34230 [Actinomadura miaoliensis]|uniref:Uncharacterized protein n=1 Tax=Actinomadura miaoliensis TaxID=430685 RepID=A0ABP7VUK1_9ACTN